MDRRKFLASSGALAGAALLPKPEAGEVKMAPSYAVPGPVIAVTANTQGLSLPTPPVPSAGGFGYAVLANCSQFLCQVNSSDGVKTLAPYTADVVSVRGGQGMIISMSIPPGGSATIPSGALSFVQADYYTAASPPPGVYPLTLVGQALQAAIAGVVNTVSYQSFEAASAVALTSLGAYNEVLNLTTAVYPSGTAQANYSTAVVEILNTSGAQATFQIVAQDVTGNYFFAQEVTMEGNSLYTYTACIPIGGMTGIFVYPFTTTSATVSVILTAEPYANPADLGYDSFGNLTPNLTSFAVNGKPGGSLVPLGPTAWANANTSGATLIAAPTAGALYIFGIDAVLGGVAAFAEVFVNSGGNPIAVLAVTATVNSTGTDHVDLDGLRTTGAVSMLFSGGAGTPTVVIRYTTGP